MTAQKIVDGVRHADSEKLLRLRTLDGTLPTKRCCEPALLARIAYKAHEVRKRGKNDFFIRRFCATNPTVIPIQTERM